MVNEEILGGLKLVLSKGGSLKQAMMSFYNAGYKKEDIEEAARALQKERVEQQEIQQKPEQPIKKPQKSKGKIIQRVSGYGEPMKEQIRSVPKMKKKMDSAIERLNVPKQKIREKTSQKVSDYGEKPKPTGKLIIFILIFFLLFLLGVLAAVFFFKKDLVEFFNNLS